MTYEELVKKAIEQQNSLLISSPEEAYIRFGKRKLDALGVEEAFEQISKKYPTYLQSVTNADQFLAWKDDKKTKELESKKAFNPQKEVNEAHNAAQADENMLQVWQGTYDPKDTPHAHLWKDPEWRGQNMARGWDAGRGAAKQGLYYTLPSIWGLGTMMWDQTLQAYTDPDKIARVQGGSGAKLGNWSVKDDWINQPEQEELHNFLADYGYTIYGSASLGRNDVIPAGYWVREAWDAGMTSSLARRKDPVGWIRGKDSKEIMSGKEVFNRAGESGFRPPSDLMFLPELYPEQQSEDFKKAFQAKYGKSFEEYIDPHINVFESKYASDKPQRAPRGVDKHRSNQLDPMAYIMNMYDSIDGQPSPWEENYNRHEDPIFQTLSNRTQRSFEYWDKKLLDSYKDDENMLAMMEWQQAEPFDLFSQDIKDWDMIVRDTGMMAGSMISMIVASKIPKVGGLIGSQVKAGANAMRASYTTSPITQAANRNFFKESLDIYMKNRKIVPPPGYIDEAAKLTDIITPFGMAAVEGSSTFKAQYDLMLQQGWTPDDAILGASYLAVMYTPGSVLLERYGLRRIGGILGFADDAVEQSFMRGMKSKMFNGFLKNSPTGQGLATIGIDGLQLTATVLQEGWTEGMQETWNMLGEKAILEGYGTNREAAMANVIRQMKDEGIQIVDVWGVGKQLGLSDREVDPQISSAAGSATISTIPLTLAGMGGKTVNNMKQVHKNHKFRTYTKQAYEKGGRVEVVVSEQEEKGFDKNGLPTSLFTVQTVEYDSQGNAIRIISEDRDIRGSELANNRKANLEKDIDKFRKASDEDIQNQANKEAADVDAQKAEPIPEAPASPEVETARAISTEYDTGGEIVAPGVEDEATLPVEQKAKQFVQEIGGIDKVEEMVSEGSLSRAQADNVINLALASTTENLNTVIRDLGYVNEEGIKESEEIVNNLDDDDLNTLLVGDIDTAVDVLDQAFKDTTAPLDVKSSMREYIEGLRAYEGPVITGRKLDPKVAEDIDKVFGDYTIDDVVEDFKREFIARKKGVPKDLSISSIAQMVPDMSNTDLNKFQKQLNLGFTTKDISTDRKAVEQAIFNALEREKDEIGLAEQERKAEMVYEPDTLEDLGIPEGALDEADMVAVMNEIVKPILDSANPVEKLVEVVGEDVTDFLDILIEMDGAELPGYGKDIRKIQRVVDNYLDQAIVKEMQERVQSLPEELGNKELIQSRIRETEAKIKDIDTSIKDLENQLLKDELGPFADIFKEGLVVRAETKEQLVKQLDALKDAEQAAKPLTEEQATAMETARMDMKRLIDIELPLNELSSIDKELEKQDLTPDRYIELLERKQILLDKLPVDVKLETESVQKTKEEKDIEKVAKKIVEDIEGCL